MRITLVAFLFLLCAPLTALASPPEPKGVAKYRATEYIEDETDARVFGTLVDSVASQGSSDNYQLYGAKVFVDAKKSGTCKRYVVRLEYKIKQKGFFGDDVYVTSKIIAESSEIPCP